MSGYSRSKLTRRFVLGGLLTGAGQAAFGEGMSRSLVPLARSKDFRATSATAADALVARARLGGKVSFVVANARTGRILEAHNPVLGLPPASVAKAMTAQYALETLGPAHAFATRIFATAPMLNGKIDGDLVLVGGGDPTLATDGLAEMAAALKSTGLREVTGRFLVSAGALPRLHEIDPEQPEHLGYNPAISGLNLNYNRVHFEWKRARDAYTVTMDARSERYRPAVSLTDMKIVNRKGPIYTYSNGGREEHWTVARSALGNGGSRWLPVRQPELYAGEVFQVFARSHGIVLKTPMLSDDPVRGTLLVERKSQPLQYILEGMLKYSTNLTAEVAGLSASVARGRNVSNLAASAQEMSHWMRQRLGARKPRFVDHSGLGDATRLSSSDLVEALIKIGPDSTLSSILKPLPMRDAAGNVLANSSASLRVKTGTLNFVSGLTGFISVGKNTELVFAIFAADLPRRDALSMAERERPPGAKSWNGKAKGLQRQLIDRWVRLYGV
ncbi:MAG: D-alanyl-D-alanine carboxypeptidase/D-alanyl-D-alanine endopeptidase [Paracoccaceae bacterium]